MKPTVGRIVHYVSHGTPVREDGTQAYAPKCRAAIVTEVIENPKDSTEENWVGLVALNPTGMFFHSFMDGGCEYSEGKAGGTWHWPEHETEEAPLGESGA
jgi:hypothetical protein